MDRTRMLQPLGTLNYKLKAALERTLSTTAKTPYIVPAGKTLE